MQIHSGSTNAPVYTALETKVYVRSVLVVYLIDMKLQLSSHLILTVYHTLLFLKHHYSCSVYLAVCPLDPLVCSQAVCPVCQGVQQGVGWINRCRRRTGNHQPLGEKKFSVFHKSCPPASTPAHYGSFPIIDPLSSLIG